jgi:hypothetical protein
MKKILKTLDEEMIEYTIDNNLSPERIKKSIERREKRLLEMKSCIEMGCLDELKKFMEENGK